MVFTQVHLLPSNSTSIASRYIVPGLIIRSVVTLRIFFAINLCINVSSSTWSCLSTKLLWCHVFVSDGCVLGCKYKGHRTGRHQCGTPFLKYKVKRTKCWYHIKLWITLPNIRGYISVIIREATVFPNYCMENGEYAWKDWDGQYLRSSI